MEKTSYGCGCDCAVNSETVLRRMTSIRAVNLSIDVCNSFREDRSYGVTQGVAEFAGR